MPIKMINPNTENNSISPKCKQAIDQCKVEREIPQRNHDHKTNHLEKKAAQQFPQNEVASFDRRCKKALQHKTLPQVE